MTNRPAKSLSKTPVSQEIFIGLIGPLGVPFDLVESATTEVLAQFNYKTFPIHLVALLQQQIEGLKTNVLDNPYDSSCKSKIQLGNEFRKVIKRNDAFTLLSLANIQRQRQLIAAEKGIEDVEITGERHAFIIRSLKTPEEVNTFRTVYGRHFVLFGIYETEVSRGKHLADRIKRSRATGKTQDFMPQALDLINTDRDETKQNPFGQHLAEAFSMADVFLNAANPEHVKQATIRVFDLLFGNPYLTPTKEEFGMFHAYAASLRSAQLGRQVGAAIASPNGEVRVVGCNEVPKAHGGCYWPDDSNDARDHIIGEDSNEQMKAQILQSLITSMQSMNWFKKEVKKQKPATLMQLAWRNPEVRTTMLMDIIDYGRAVHAEMSALLQAARLGVSVLGNRLFTTTFPCHNCAKHIVKAGISQVHYIEPYPKSLAVDLHSDSIDVDGNGNEKVNFIPFVGIAPRLFVELFNMRDIPRKSEGKIIAFVRGLSSYRFRTGSAAYFLQEHSTIVEFTNLLDSAKLNLVFNEPQNVKDNATTSSSAPRGFRTNNVVRRRSNKTRRDA
jgi:deoxycytidylate deaminase